MNDGVVQVPISRFCAQKITSSELDTIASEVPVALVYNGISHVIMMISPADIEYFAIGFSLSENIIQSPKDIYSLDIVTTDLGIEVHIDLSSRRFVELKHQRRALVGRTGCGICGHEHLDSTNRVIPKLNFTQRISLSALYKGMAHFADVQTIGNVTGCTHSALWLDSSGELLGGFEDVGRHVALDKILGFRASQAKQEGMMIISSRASYEMVQKAAQCGIEILCALSAPTALAVQKAQDSYLTLLGFCRNDAGIIYTCPQRIVEE